MAEMGGGISQPAEIGPEDLPLTNL